MKPRSLEMPIQHSLGTFTKVSKSRVAEFTATGTAILNMNLSENAESIMAPPHCPTPINAYGICLTLPAASFIFFSKVRKLISDMHARVVLLLLLSFPAIAAQDCQSVLESVRDFTSPVISEYPELYQVRNDIMLLIYSEAECSQEIAEFSAAGVEFLRKMDYAYGLLEDSPEEAIASASSASSELEELERLAQAVGGLAPGISESAGSGWRSFLVDIGDRHYARASEAGSTAAEIYELSLAEKAYAAAGSPRALVVGERVKRLKSAYLRDMQRAEAAMSSGESLLALAEASMKKPAGFLSAYPSAREGVGKLKLAEHLYGVHREKERLGTARSLRERGEELVAESRRGIIAFFGLLMLVLVPLSAYLQGAVDAWRRDGDECRLGAELMGD